MVVHFKAGAAHLLVLNALVDGVLDGVAMESLPIPVVALDRVLVALYSSVKLFPYKWLFCPSWGSRRCRSLEGRLHLRRCSGIAVAQPFGSLHPRPAVAWAARHQDASWSARSGGYRSG